MGSPSRQVEAETEKRSAYPLYSLSRAVVISGAVADLGGAKTPVSKSLLARHLSMDESAAALTQAISATKTFGLIIGRGSYRLSEIGIHYFYPTNNTEKRRAILAAIKTPTVFESLINRFDGGRLPTNDMLVNILHREHDVTESWRPRLASLFLSSLRDAGVVDGAGYLRYQASLDGASSSNVDTMNIAVQQVAAEIPPDIVQPQTSLPFVQSPGETIGRTTWSHKGLRVDTPDPLTLDLWQKLINYVNVLKPEGDEK